MNVCPEGKARDLGQMRMRTSYLSQSVLARGRKSMPQRKSVCNLFLSTVFKNAAVELVQYFMALREVRQAQISTEGNGKQGWEWAKSKYVVKDIFNPNFEWSIEKKWSIAIPPCGPQVYCTVCFLT